MGNKCVKRLPKVINLCFLSALVFSPAFRLAAINIAGHVTPTSSSNVTGILYVLGKWEAWVLCSRKCLFWVKQDEKYNTNIFVFWFLGIAFDLVPGSSFAELITNYSLNANLLTRFNNTYHSTKSTGETFSVLCKCWNLKTLERQISLKTISLVLFCACFWSWDPPLWSALRLWNEKITFQTWSVSDTCNVFGRTKQQNN